MTEKHDQIIKDSLILFIATSIINLSNFVFHMYVSRKLGPANYGVLVTLLAMIMIASMPAMALQMTVVKKTSICAARGNYAGIMHLFKKTMKWFSILGIVYFAALCAAIPLIRSFFKIEDSGLVVILGLIMFISIVLPVVRGILQGLQNFMGFGLNQIADALLRLGFVLLFFYLGFGLRGALASTFFSASASLIIGFFMLSFLYKYKGDGTELIRKRDLLSYATPVFLSMTGFSLLSYLDVFVVKHFFSEYDAGLYSATSMIGKAFLFFPGAIGMTLFPKAAQNFELGHGTKKMLYKSLLLTAGISFAGIVFCFFFPGFVINLLYGNKFSGIEGIVRLFGAAILPLVLFNIVMNYCLAVHRYIFIYILYAGIMAYTVLLWFFHSNFYQVIGILFAVNLAILLCSLLAVGTDKKGDAHAV